MISKHSGFWKSRWNRAPSRLFWNAPFDFKRSLQKTDELKRDLSLRGVLGDLVGTSPAMQQIFSLIRQVAPTSAPVLIRGESGTGKELVAREIHKCSPRGDGPFVAINARLYPRL